MWIALLFVGNLWAAPLLQTPRTLSHQDYSQDPAIRAKKPVLIYFANDVEVRLSTDWSAGLRKLVQSLESASGTADEQAFLQELAKRLVGDIDAFNYEVELERAALTDALCISGSRFEAGLAIFRNSGNSPHPANRNLYARIPWEYCPATSKDGLLRRTSVDLPLYKELATDGLSLAQPLTAANGIYSALQAVQSVFPPSDHRYILVIKSFADAEHFIQPWFQRDLSKVSGPQAVAALLAGRASLTEPGGTAVLRGARLYVPLQAVLGPLAAEPLMQALSVSKQDFLEAMGQLGGGDPRQGVYFTAFLSDGPVGALELSREAKLQKYARVGDYQPLNIYSAHLYAARQQGEALNHGLPYADLFKSNGLLRGDMSRDFSDRFDVWLNKLSQGGLP
ncbi:hypothetical protein K2X33_15380 [bacterium]|nr:hypothetical protein [bacterium]